MSSSLTASEDPLVGLVQVQALQGGPGGGDVPAAPELQGDVLGRDPAPGADGDLHPLLPLAEEDRNHAPLHVADEAHEVVGVFLGPRVLGQVGGNEKPAKVEGHRGEHLAHEAEVGRGRNWRRSVSSASFTP